MSHFNVTAFSPVQIILDRALLFQKGERPQMIALLIKEGWTTAKANSELTKIRANLTTGTGHQSIRDSRWIEKTQRIEEDRKKRLEQQQADRAQDLMFNNVFVQYCESNSHDGEVFPRQ